MNEVNNARISCKSNGRSTRIANFKVGFDKSLYKEHEFEIDLGDKTPEKINKMLF